MSTIMPKLDKMSKLYETYKKTYDIKFCDLNEIDDIVQFIDKYWKNNHILVKSRKLMDWQHLDKLNNRYNFVLARHKATNELHAILGLIPTSQFDSNIPFKFVWGAIWKVREDVAFPGLGVCLFYFLKTNTPIEVYVGFGLSNDAINNHKSMGFQLGKAEHFFFVNPYKTDFKISYGINHLGKEFNKNKGNWKVKLLSKDDYNRLDMLESIFSNNYKSKDYYLNRYFNHPVYKYDFLGIYAKERIESILIIRECHVDDSVCLRIVEYVGDYAALKNVSNSLCNYLKERNAEYFDIFASNVDFQIFKDSGFYNISEYENVIIPNYFEPFLQKNIELDFAYSTSNEDFKLVVNKGDSDQDRPSTL